MRLHVLDMADTTEQRQGAKATIVRAQGADDSGQSRGAGLGLAIAKRAIELHGGNIRCESTAGEGTTFRFELPAESSTSSVPLSP